jgi:hypothetical protein
MPGCSEKRSYVAGMTATTERERPIHVDDEETKGGCAWKHVERSPSKAVFVTLN